jgi:hypothetical protein
MQKRTTFFCEMNFVISYPQHHTLTHFCVFVLFLFTRTFILFPSVTDPKNADYEMESGGTRNYEVWHDETKTNAEFDKQAEEDEKLDSMKALENRVAESQREMAELDALEEIRAMNQRHVSLMSGRGKGGKKSSIDVAEAVLRAREAAGMGGVGSVHLDDEGGELNENGLTKEEEDLVRSIQFGSKPKHRQGTTSIAAVDGTLSSSGTINIRRLNEEDELLDEKYRREEAESLVTKQQEQHKANAESSRPSSSNNNNIIMPVIKVKRKKVKDVTPTSTTTVAVPDTKRIKVDNDKSPAVLADNTPGGDDFNDGDGSGGALGGLLGYYGSDSD